MREYDLIADWYPTDRGQTVGVAEALAIADTLRAGERRHLRSAIPDNLKQRAIIVR
jgi:hypothetical protein